MLTRILTAIILIPCLILAIFKLPAIYFSAVVALLVLIGAWEWSALSDLAMPSQRLLFVLVVAVGLFFSAFAPALFILITASLIWIWFFVAIVRYQKTGFTAGFQPIFVRVMIGLIVLIATWNAIVLLETDPDFGPAWLILALCIIWAADVGAYFAGRFFGKTPLCSRVSPKKTREGFFGGFILSIIVAIVGAFVMSFTIEQSILLIVLTIFTMLFSVVGDLGVSMLKRIAGVKDSGKIFPGHGGMLDRMDSVAAAMVIFVLGAVMLGL